MESTAINNASVIYSQSTTTPQAVQDPLEHPLREASERVDPIIEAVTEVDRINVDIAGAVQTTLSVVPGVVALRPTLVQNGLFDITHLDNLRDYALALAYAQSRYRTAVGTPDTTAVEHLVKVRARLHAHATAFSFDGLFDSVQLDNLKHGNNHQQLAYDVIGLVDLLLEKYPELAGRTSLQQAELGLARRAASDMLSILAAKEKNPSANAAVKLRRQKAFTVLARAYADVREAVAYARRRENDVDSIIPSLAANRGGRKSDSAADDDGDVETELAATQQLNAAVAHAFAPATGAPSTPGAAPAAGAAPVPAGFPGALPLQTHTG
jgi:hypothetical protein